jgi:hypothetical protein
MNRANFTDYDLKPAGMVNYMRYYGPHFSKKLCEFAVSMMTKEGGTPIKPMSKAEVKEMLQKYDITLEHDQLFDSTYVCAMGLADYYGSSIEDEKHLARYIKDVIDDPDATPGTVFNRFYADCCYNGIAIDWDEML